MSSVVYRAVAAPHNETGRWFVLIFDMGKPEMSKARILVKNKKAMFFNHYNDILKWSRGVNAFLDGTTQEVDKLTEQMMTRQVEVSSFVDVHARSIDFCS